MYLIENPVLQRELLVNLRATRAFVLLFVYQLLLAGIVYLAWPREQRLEANAVAARGLVDLVFLGQFMLASLMTPSFAASSITGEKERKTYEMLLASPLRPSAIVLGKLLASLAYLAVLIFSSLPIVLVCLPLGGVSIYEVLAAYLGLLFCVITFGMISVACSSYFNHTSASLVVSYLLILPLAFLGVLFWQRLAEAGEARLILATTFVPLATLAMFGFLFRRTADRLLHPPDVGSEGKEVVNPEAADEEVVGLVIRRDQFPDRLFAPPKRADLLPDGANPVLDKEIQSELFSQGTLMLRLVIQISMLLAIPLMAVFIFILPGRVAWYIAYAITFTILVSPVFLAGSVTSERERQTLDLLLTTNISPRHILWGKLLAGLRVASVLTLFLLWPLCLGCVLVPFYWKNLLGVLAYLVIIALACATAGLTALFFSVIFRRTSTSLMSTYLVLVVVCFGPVAADFFARTFYAGTVAETVTRWTGVASPYTAAFSVPLSMDQFDLGFQDAGADGSSPAASLALSATFIVFTTLIDVVLIVLIQQLFHRRWRVSQ